MSEYNKHKRRKFWGEIPKKYTKRQFALNFNERNHEIIAMESIKESEYSKYFKDNIYYQRMKYPIPLELQLDNHEILTAMEK